ncbi:hypothetical protein [Winogradskyella rapida]|uniref:PGAP1-like protein n=1 Tax=Winogradskyella rapida TaxID=549701 RepID=A0ABW3KPB4_9FLAO
MQSIAIDFGNGSGYINMPFDGNYQLQYTEEGIYDWTYKLTLTNGQILYSQSRMIFEETLYDAVSQSTIMKRAISEPCSVNDLGIDQVEFVGTQNYLGQTNTATIEIDYLGSNDCDDGITKPLIVVEGFDSGLLGMENGLGDVDYERFFKEATINAGNLGITITDYDIIYVNWDKGRDHLQRNALLLEDIIQWVNSEKTANGSTEQNVVLGQSMGGVIARYALADMEDDPDLDHDTKLYISHDAPHQGANIPLGIQYFARHLADQFISTPLGDYSFEVSDGGNASIQEISALFNETGTQQLLSNYITSNFSLNNDVHAAWQADLLSKGYPTLTRNIAISNGSQCANTQEYDYNASLFRMNGNARTRVLTDILGSYLGIVDDIALAVIFDEPALILGVLPGSSRFDLDFNAKALPIANTSENIYEGNVSYTKQLLWFIDITVNLTDRSYNNPVNLSYDNYSGGRFELFEDIDPIDYFDDDEDYDGDGDDDLTQFQADMLNALMGSANINFNIEETFGFIPTLSALDVGSGSTNLDNDDYFRTFGADNPPTGNLGIPFDNFITAYFNSNSENEEHISFNFRNGDWLAAELDPDVAIDIFDCTAFCSNAEIIGEDTLCSTGVYSVTDLATTVNWTVTDPNNLVSFTTNGNEITLNQLDPNNYGTISITVIYSNDECGEIEVSKEDIEVGIIPYHLDNALITGATSICDSQYYTYILDGLSHPCVTSIDWTVSDNLTIISQTNTSVTVTRNIANDDYAGLITANLPNSSFVIEKGIWVGVPSNDGLSIQKIGVYDLTVGTWTKLYAQYIPILYQANEPLNITYEWQIPNSAIRNYDDTAYKDVMPNTSGQLNIGVRAVCDCGNGEWQYQLFDVLGNGGGNELIRN